VIDCLVCLATTAGTCQFEDAVGTIAFYTAGKRIVPSDCSSPFVWKPSPTTSFPMTYTDWMPNQPDCYFDEESCLHYWDPNAYQSLWNDMRCSLSVCSICQIDVYTYDEETSINKIGQLKIYIDVN